jgi:hypothetical protein
MAVHSIENSLGNIKRLPQQQEGVRCKQGCQESVGGAKLFGVVGIQRYNVAKESGIYLKGVGWSYGQGAMGQRQDR